MEDFVVRAGAGAGKTTELVQRVLQSALYFRQQHQRWPKLIVTTFTRKATQELRERLLRQALQMGQAELVEFVQRESLLHVSTIHGVLSLFLASAGSHLGLSPRFQMVDALAEKQLFKKVLRQWMRNADVDSMKDLDLLLLDSTLNQLIASLQIYFHLWLENGQSLALATTDDLQAANRRLEERWAEQAEEFWEQTQDQKGKGWDDYRSFLKQACAAIRNQEIDRLEKVRFFAEYKPKGIRLKEREDLKDLRKAVQSGADALPENWLLSDAAPLKHKSLSEAFSRLAQNMAQTVLQQKCQSSTLTMSDLESFALLLVHNHPEAAAGFASEWDYWFVDEYQDTSPRQVRILQSLQQGRKSFTVGDPQQSIYLFRGARAEVFTQKEEDIAKRSGQLLQKRINYRSTPALLQFFNQFFSNLSSQFTAMESPSPVPDSVTAVAEYWTCEPDVDADVVAVRRCQDWIAAGVPPEEICCLARTNSQLQSLAAVAQQAGLAVQVHSSSQFLLRREVQDTLALLKFLCNPHDNRNLLILLRSPWFHVPDHALAQRLATAQSPLQSFWIHLQSAKADANFVSVIALLDELLQQADLQGLRTAWENGLVRAGLLDFAEAADSTGRHEANVWKLVTELRGKERQPGFRYLDFAEQAGLASLDPEKGEDGDATPVEVPQRVNLMTIHAAKGLQFQHVILIGVGRYRPQIRAQNFVFDEQQKKFGLGLVHPETGILKATPWAAEWSQELRRREKDEYDRVLYVALTRAKNSVVLFWSPPSKESWAARLWRPAEDEARRFGLRVETVSQTPELRSIVTSAKNQVLIPPPWAGRFDRPAQTFSVSEILSLSEAEGAFAAGSTRAAKGKSPATAPGDSVDQAIEGVRIHRLLESLRYQASQVGSLSSAKDQTVLEFLRTWKEGKILRWIQAGHVEDGFCIQVATPKGGEFWIQGQIDLWAEDSGTLWVVDYKTGSPAHSEMAFRQLDLYAWALQRMGLARGLDVQAAVIYPLSQLVKIQQAQDQHKTEAWVSELLLRSVRERK